MKKIRNRKGFTLAELLIVVAIIAVLVAIAIPVFTAQLEKARESTDLSNIRAAYAEVSADALLDDTADNITRTVELKQQQNGWQTTGDLLIGEVDVSGLAVAKGGSVEVAWVPTAGTAVGHVEITMA